MWSRRAAVRAFVWEEERRAHVEAPPSRRGQEPVKLAEELSEAGRDLSASGARTGRGSVAVEGGIALAEASTGTLRQVGASPPVSAGGDGLLRSPRDPRRLRERALVRAAQRGDAAALEALFRAHWPAAYRAAWFIVRDDQAAADLAQEACL